MSTTQQAAPSCSSEGRSSRGELGPEHLAELHESKQELILKVQALKKELQDWRGRTEAQVRGYKAELVGLHASLQEDVAGLRQDLQGLKARIRAQLAASGDMAGTMARSSDPPTRALAAAALQ